MTEELANDITNTPTDDATQETVQDTVEQETQETPQAEQALPDVYDFSEFCTDGVEMDTDRAEDFSHVLKEAGMTQAQARAVTKYGLDYAREVADAAVAQAEAQRNAEIKTWGDEAREQLGAEFDGAVKDAAVAITYLERDIPELRDMLNQTGFGNRVEAIRLFAAIGKMVGEDKGAANGTAGQEAGDAASFYSNTNFDLY